MSFLLFLFVLLANLLPATSVAPSPQQQATADGICFAQYVWDTSNEAFPDGYWNFPFPENTLGAIDLRSLPDMAPGPVPTGYGLFALDDIDACIGPNVLASINLASMDSTLRPLEVTALEIGLGLVSGDLQETTARGIIREVIAVHADPTGSTRWKPVRGSLRDGYKIYLPGYGLIVDEPFTISHPAMIQTILTFQSDYDRNLRSGMDDETLRKFTGAAMLDLFGEATDERATLLMAPQYRSRRWEHPTTTVTDDFNRADGELGADWTDDTGDADIVSNAWDVTTAEVVSRYSGTSLSSDDHYAEAVFTDSGYYLGPAVRKAASSTLTYYVAAVQSNKTDWQWYKRVSGSYTLLQTVNITNHLATDTLQGRVDGSTLSLWRNASQEGTNLTDASITGNLQVALVSNGATGIADNFEAADLAAPPAGARRIIFIN